MRTEGWDRSRHTISVGRRFRRSLFCSFRQTAPEFCTQNHVAGHRNALARELGAVPAPGTRLALARTGMCLKGSGPLYNVVPIALAIVAWGVWGFASKRAIEYTSPVNLQWMLALPWIVAAPLFFHLGRRGDSMASLPRDALFWGITAGVMAISGYLFLSFGLRSHAGSRAIAWTAAYPIVTMVLAVLSGYESWSLWRTVGVAAVFVGLLCFSLDSATS